MKIKCQTPEQRAAPQLFKKSLSKHIVARFQNRGPYQAAGCLERY